MLWVVVLAEMHQCHVEGVIGAAALLEGGRRNRANAVVERETGLVVCDAFKPQALQLEGGVVAPGVLQKNALRFPFVGQRRRP